MLYTLYGKPNCTFCEQAKQLLSKYNFKYNYVDLSQYPEKLAEFKEQGFRTVPIIYNDYGLIGGFEDLQDYLIDTLV